jgi:hypothetical protein
MSKIGFIQDLIRGIKKVLAAETEKTRGIEHGTDGSMSSMTPGITQLLDRVDILLEDGDFKTADEYCNRILDLEPRNAKAYFKKLLSSLKLRNEEDVLSYSTPLDDYGDYQKAVRFADDSYRETLEGYNTYIIGRLESERLEGLYQKAIQLMESASAKRPKEKIKTLEEAGKLLEAISSSDQSHINSSEAQENISALIAEAKEQIRIMDEELRLAEEERQRKNEEQKARDKEFSTIMNSLLERKGDLERESRRISALNFTKKAEVQHELRQVYERIREVRKQYGKE